MMTRRRGASAVLQIETLEGRVVLSAAAHPLHAADAIRGHAVEVRAEASKAASGPVLVNLTPDTTGITISSVAYDPRLHLITVKGTADVSPQSPPPYEGYTPSYPGTVYFGFNATQAVTRFQSVTGYEYSNASIADATVTTVPFTGRFIASAGKFESGIVNISVTVSNSNEYNYQTYSVIARMHNAKAY